MNKYFFTGFEEIDIPLIAKVGDIIGVAGVAGIGVENLLKNFALNAIRRGQKIGWADTNDIMSDFLLINSDISERAALFGMNGVQFQKFVGSSVELRYTEKGSPDVEQVLPWEWEKLCDCWGGRFEKPEAIFIPNLLDCIANITEKKTLQDKISFVLAKIHSYAKTNDITIFIGIPMTMVHSPGYLPTRHDLNADNRDYFRFCDKIIVLHRREYFDPLDKPNLAEIHFLKSGDCRCPVELEYSSESMIFSTCKPFALDKDDPISQSTHDLFADFEV
jgi:hypothetical protein